MVEYKSYRIIGGKSRWVIVDGNGTIINRNPNKEKLKHSLLWNFEHNETNTCNFIKENGEICGNELKPGKTLKEYIDNKWTGRWLCHKCYQKFDPNSTNNIRKSLTNRRIGNLDPSSNQAKGDNFQELTCRWRSTVSTIPVEDLNKTLDNYTTPIDHSRDSELGIIQTQGRLYDSVKGTWNFNSEREWHKEFDYEISYCVSSDGKCIERIYIFPWKEIIKRITISIYKEPLKSRGPFWYEQYRIEDKEVLIKVNEIWKKIIA